MSASSSLPARVGVIGVGTIGSAIVRGLCGGDGVPSTTRLVISPRSAARAAALASDFPEAVCVAGSNQEVVDRSDCLILAVLPRQAAEVLGALTFREGQQVISLVAALKLPRVRELVAPASDCAIASALPAVAVRRGVAISAPGTPFCEAIFARLGSYVAAKDEAEFLRLTCVLSFMGDFYKRQLTMQEWLVEQGTPASQAATWVNAALSTFLAGSGDAGPDTFARLVAEQTAGGLNEMVWKEQEADGAYRALKHSLDSVHHRKQTGTSDPDLAPAAKRARL